MRSIRLSLMVYFLGLLAVALAAASVLVYQTAGQTLREKQEATGQLIQAQYEESCKEEQARIDDGLLAEAQTLARLAQFQFDWSRLRHRELNVLGLLAVAPAPNAYALVPSWAGQGLHGPFFFELHRRNLGEITFDGTDVLEQASDKYFQIDSAWGASYRSQSLGDRSFPVGPDAFAADQGPSWEFSDYPLGPDAPVRRVVLKTFARILPQFKHNKGEPFRPERPAAPDAPRKGDGFHPERADRPAPPELQPRSAICIQCASSARDRDAALAAVMDLRDQRLTELGARSDASLTELRNRLLLTSTITFLFAVVGCYGLVRLGLSPLRRLSDAVSRVSEKDFRLPVDPRRLPGELKPIARRMTDTLEMLKRAFAREKQATADISHELRTPLAALLTTTEIALRKPRTAEEYREMLRDCRLSAQQMTQAVERLLALARLDAGVDRLRPQMIDAAQLAEQCAALVRPLAEARGLKLTVHCDGPAPVTADPDKLREVLTNLLHNAVEYNRPDGAIDVTVVRRGGVTPPLLEVEVTDTGVGIDSKAKAHLFERFYRADPSRAGDGLHAGLGLAIVKGYIDLMHGAIEVESVEGQGSTFRVRLPAA